MRSILVQLSLFVHYFLLSWYRLFVLIEKREKKKASVLLVLSFLSLSFSAENTSCFCIYIYINQKICECSHAVFSSPSSSLYWPNLESTLFYYFDSSIPTYKNRVCIYIQKEIISSIYTRVLYDSIFSRLYLILVDICSIRVSKNFLESIPLRTSKTGHIEKISYGM